MLTTGFMKIAGIIPEFANLADPCWVYKLAPAFADHPRSMNSRSRGPTGETADHTIQTEECVRAAELIAALSLATDLGTSLPLEHGLESTLFAMRLVERLGFDSDTAVQTYYGCLLFYVGCTADAEIAAELFPDDDALVTHFTPVMFGSPREIVMGLARALVPSAGGPLARTARVIRTIPRLVRERRHHVAAICEVAQMLSRRLGLSTDVQSLFADFTERWDGKGPNGIGGDDIPLAVRIIHVARDATFHRMLGGVDQAASLVQERAGHAFDPDIAAPLVDEAESILSLEGGRSVWSEALACEPSPHIMLQGSGIDRALAAMGDFADLISPYLAGHSSRVATLAANAAELSDIEPKIRIAINRAAFVHDLGRVTVPAGIWKKTGALTPDEWERLRLHPYHSERFLTRSPFLAPLRTIVGSHHERLDGSGYPRGTKAPALPRSARLLAATEAYCGMTEPRAHREALSPMRAADNLGQEVGAGRLDADAVAAVLEASGQPPPPLERPAGLTEREGEVLQLLARGHQTKQIARALGISAKTADHHIQNSYRKIGVSTRVAAALFAMEHGLVTWGEFPIGSSGSES